MKTTSMFGAEFDPGLVTSHDTFGPFSAFEKKEKEKGEEEGGGNEGTKQIMYHKGGDVLFSALEHQSERAYASVCTVPINQKVVRCVLRKPERKRTSIHLPAETPCSLRSRQRRAQLC